MKIGLPNGFSFKYISELKKNITNQQNSKHWTKDIQN